MEITLHAGGQYDTNTIHVDWMDENGIFRRTEVAINIQDQDKPRTLEVLVNERSVFEIQAHKEVALSELK